MWKLLKYIFIGTPEQRDLAIKVNNAYVIFLNNMLPIILLFLGLHHPSLLLLPFMLSTYWYIKWRKTRTKTDSPLLNYSLYWYLSTWIIALVAYLGFMKVINIGFVIAVVFIFPMISLVLVMYDYRDQNLD